MAKGPRATRGPFPHPGTATIIPNHPQPRSIAMWRHTATLIALVLPTASSGRAATSMLDAAAREAVVGRWDITIQKTGATAPSWLEIRPSGRAMLVGRLVAEVGSARPIARIDLDSGKIRFSVPPQWEEGAGDLMFAGTVQGNQLSGTVTFPDGKQFPWTARRAPALRRASPPVWGAPIRLFSGSDLSGWHTVGGTSRWQGANFVLRNSASGGNLVTDRSFDDFKLHIEFRYPKGSNSGIYLRGRYELQVMDSKGAAPSKGDLGAIYGFIMPSEMVAKDPGEWQTYDITLVGRMITVVANGKQIICNQEIPGITGGALDSNEGEPGPILFQGDHGAVEYRNIIITPAK